MKFAVFSLLTGELTFEETAALLARLGYEGVEWRVADIPQSAPGDSNWTRFSSTIDMADLEAQCVRAKRAADAHGLEVCCLGSYLNLHETERIEALFAQAARMSCPMVRVRPPGYSRDRHYHDLYDEAVRQGKVVEELARRHGVKAVLELHMGNIIPSASLGRRLVENFDPQHFGVIHDPGNMVFEGYENWRLGLQLLGPYLAHVHVKNMAWFASDVDADGNVVWQPRSTSMRAGQANWREIIGDLKSVGYTGWLSMEDFNQTPIARRLEEDIQYIRSLM